VIEVFLQYEVPAGGVRSESLGLAVTMRQVRDLMWNDAEKFHGKDVILNKDGDKYAVYINGKLDTTEWYVIKGVW
jgi:hypothetical protein